MLVVKDFQLNIMSPEDLNELGGLIATVITQRQVVPFNAGIGLLKWHLEMMFGTVTETELAKGDDEGSQLGTVLRVFDTIDIKKLASGPNQVTLEWVGNAMNDMVADSVLAMILSIDSSPASVKGTKKRYFLSLFFYRLREYTDFFFLLDPIASSQSCSHDHTSTKKDDGHYSEKLDKEFLDITAFLEAHFGQVETDEKDRKVVVKLDGSNATINTVDFVSIE